MEKNVSLELPKGNKKIKKRKLGLQSTNGPANRPPPATGRA